MKDILTYKGFIGSVHYASEDRLLYGKVEGSTVDELEEGFKYMVNEHIKDCQSTTQKSCTQYINDALKKDLASSDADL